MRPILLATGNPAKAAKLSGLLEGLPLAPIALAGRPDLTLPEESGQSFAENARLKAGAASEAFRGLAVASDGGIVIPTLGPDWDPVRTARAAGPAATDAGRALHLLGLLKGRRGEERRVLWTEAVAVALDGRVLEAWQEAGNQGYLTEDYDPANAIPGFWVYSLWYYPQLGKRYVDLDPGELGRMDETWNRLRERFQQWVRSALA